MALHTVKFTDATCTCMSVGACLSHPLFLFEGESLSFPRRVAFSIIVCPFGTSFIQIELLTCWRLFVPPSLAIIDTYQLPLFYFSHVAASIDSMKAILSVFLSLAFRVDRSSLWWPLLYNSAPPTDLTAFRAKGTLTTEYIFDYRLDALFLLVVFACQVTPATRSRFSINQIGLSFCRHISYCHGTLYV